MLCAVPVRDKNVVDDDKFQRAVSRALSGHPHRQSLARCRSTHCELAHTRLEQAAKLLEAAGEELLAEEADALAERVDLAEAAVRH